jgi:hypothetical protein
MKNIALIIISVLYFAQAQAYEYEGVRFPKDSILAGKTLIGSRHFLVTKIDTLENTLFYRCSYYGDSGACSITFNFGQMHVFYYYDNAKEQSIGFKNKCAKITNSRYSMSIPDGSNENEQRIIRKTKCSCETKRKVLSAKRKVLFSSLPLSIFALIITHGRHILRF